MIADVAAHMLSAAVSGETPVPAALRDPAGVWVFNWVVPIVGSTLILLAVADSIRRRRLTWGFLFLASSLGVYWQETIGDWGQHLVYSPSFAQHHLLDWLPWKTPYDPAFMPFAYAVYWGIHAVVVLYVASWLRRRFGWSMLKAILVLAIPVNYAWDMLVEGVATAMGWWTYDPGLGPIIRWSSGGQITLIWTIGLMCVWPNLIAYWAGKPPVRTLNHLERFFALERFTRPRPVPPPIVDDATVPFGSTALSTRPTTRVTKQHEYDAALDYEPTIARWKFELLRLGAWVVGFQVSFFLLLIVPLVALRMLTGADSVYVP